MLALHPAQDRKRLAAFATLLLTLGLAGASPAAAQVPVESLRGVVVTAGPTPAGVLEAAREATTLELRAEVLSPRTGVDDPSLDARLAGAELAWSEADFPGCRAQLAEISEEQLLARGDVTRAGRRASLEARCTFGLGELAAARGLVRAALVAGLPGADAGSPDYRQLVDEVRAELAPLGRVSLEVSADVPRLRLFVDGRPSRCTASPCSVDVLPGEHVVVIEALGYTTHVARVSVLERRTHDVRLARAPAAEALADVERALGDGLSFDDPALHDALPSILEEPIVVLAWSRADAGHAVVVDRTLGRVLSRASATGERGLADAVRAAVGEWWGVARPVPLAEDPVFWAVLGVSAAVIGVGAGLLIGLVPTGEPDVVVRF